MALESNGELVTSGAYTQIGATFDFEAFKLSIDSVIKANATNNLGTYSIQVEVMEDIGGSSHKMYAVVTFQNMIDACHFAPILAPADPVPDFCAVFLPTANPNALFF